MIETNKFIPDLKLNPNSMIFEVYFPSTGEYLTNYQDERGWKISELLETGLPKIAKEYNIPFEIIVNESVRMTTISFDGTQGVEDVIETFLLKKNELVEHINGIVDSLPKYTSVPKVVATCFAPTYDVEVLRKRHVLMIEEAANGILTLQIYVGGYYDGGISKMNELNLHKLELCDEFHLIDFDEKNLPAPVLAMIEYANELGRPIRYL